MSQDGTMGGGSTGTEFSPAAQNPYFSNMGTRAQIGAGQMPAMTPRMRRAGVMPDPMQMPGAGEKQAEMMREAMARPQSNYQAPMPITAGLPMPDGGPANGMIAAPQLQNAMPDPYQQYLAERRAQPAQQYQAPMTGGNAIQPENFNDIFGRILANIPRR